MARKIKNIKPLVYVFCEGESEQEYARFLKEQFVDVVSIKYPSDVGRTAVFEMARDNFTKNAKYKDNISVTDEIWFFFDVEQSDKNKWDERYKIIEKLRKLKKKPNIKVSLLMTTACIEYWFMLHYKMVSPVLSTVADKDRIRHQLEQLNSGYFKGDRKAILKIAQNYSNAVKNGKKTLQNLKNDGLPTLEDTDERNKWLYRSSLTFTTVHEAIIYLESLK